MEPQILEPPRRRTRVAPPSARAPRARTHTAAWAVTAAVVLGAAIAFVAIVGFKPSFDPYGWLVWGRQTLHWNLNTDAAPSWKPLTFIFTLPYALFGSSTAVWLWSVTATAGWLAGAVFGARIAYGLTPRSSRRWAPYVAGAFAGVGVLGLDNISHWVLIANSDPLNVTLLLAAIDAHLCRRPRLAFVVLFLAALGRPEVWPFLGLYAVWLWVRVPEARKWTVAILVLTAASWFVVPGLTSKSLFSPGDLALNQRTIIHGNKVIGVIQRWRSTYEVPMQIAAALGVLLAAVRRDLETLVLAGAAVLWVIIEIGFAYHGWSAVARYLLESGAVMVVIAGAFVGRVLAETADLIGPTRPLRLLGPVVVVALLAALVPAVHHRAQDWHAQVVTARRDAKWINALPAVIRRAGGAGAIKRCGQPVSYNRMQSVIGWAVGLNVGDVGFNVQKVISEHRPIVVIIPHAQYVGWQVKPYWQRGAAKAACAGLNIDTGHA